MSCLVWRRALCAAVAVFCFFAVPDAFACSVCGCGDPLVAAGDAMPMAGNLRVALEGEYLTAQAASDEDPDATESLAQTTLRPILVASPLNRLNLVLQVPLVRKTWSLLGAGPGELVDHFGLGDIDLGARWFLWEADSLSAQRRQSFAVSAGLSLPTGPTDAMEGAVRIDDHAQLGTGSVGPYAGLLYALHQDPWNLGLSVSGRAHTTNGYGYQYGPALLWSARGTFRPWERFAFMVGLDGRYAGRDVLEGELQTNTGGLLLAVVPGVAVNVVGNLWLHVVAQVPVFSHLFGEQSVGPVIATRLQYSFGT